jgi:hypothetical protein
MNICIKMKSSAFVTRLDAERQLRKQFQNKLIATCKNWNLVH